MYVADGDGCRVWRVAPDETASVAAGTGTPGFRGDGGPAVEAELNEPSGLALGLDGEPLHRRRAQRARPPRRRPTASSPRSPAGTSPAPARRATAAPRRPPGWRLPRPDPDDVCGLVGLAVGPSGDLYVADVGHGSVRRIAPAFDGISDSEILIASEDGKELYVFDGVGRHLETLDAATGALIYRFVYDAAWRLKEIHDGSGAVTRVERKAGRPVGAGRPGRGAHDAGNRGGQSADPDRLADRPIRGDGVRRRRPADVVQGRAGARRAVPLRGRRAAGGSVSHRFQTRTHRPPAGQANSGQLPSAFSAAQPAGQGPLPIVQQCTYGGVPNILVPRTVFLLTIQPPVAPHNRQAIAAPCQIIGHARRSGDGAVSGGIRRETARRGAPRRSAMPEAAGKRRSKLVRRDGSNSCLDQGSKERRAARRVLRDGAKRGSTRNRHIMGANPRPTSRDREGARRKPLPPGRGSEISEFGCRHAHRRRRRGVPRASGPAGVGRRLGQRRPAARRRTAEVARLMTCLTVTPDSAAEAVAEGAGLIVTHHPILFRAIKRLTDATAEGRMLLVLARAGVAVYSPHTAFDDAAEGINALLARRLGLVGVGPLRHRDDARMCKVVVFTPEKDRTASPTRCSSPARPHRPIQRVQFSPARHRHFLRFRGDASDRRSEGPPRGGDRMAAGGGLSRGERGGRHGGDPTQPFLRGTGLRHLPVASDGFAQGVGRLGCAAGTPAAAPFAEAVRRRWAAAPYR